MKIRCLTYLLLLVMTLGLLFTSCDGDDGSSVQNIEGHWVYSGTKADVYAIDSVDQARIENYIQNRTSDLKLSYEFKNDKTYYYYQSLEEPMKGIVKPIDKEYFIMDDAKGKKTLAAQDSLIYVVSDLKEEIVRELEIDERRLVKALAVDTFTRGLYVE
ncbi:hypothetical protein [Dysgonomonas sp. Marseille-P4361]|uniref:hypothetical protein n=1 Tax=Dysgonomonas sp. Marseille-P4361 TaxID=2161820 RepID=UPI000D550954|nr:hypothetical protein [Dysgonomonas sp. Marseille-P4361]